MPERLPDALRRHGLLGGGEEPAPKSLAPAKQQKM